MRLEEDARFGGLVYGVVAGFKLPWEWFLRVYGVFCRAAVVWGREFSSVGGVSFCAVGVVGCVFSWGGGVGARVPHDVLGIGRKDGAEGFAEFDEFCGTGLDGCLKVGAG